MSKIKEYLETHVEKCGLACKTKPYYISYGEVLEMVYLNQKINLKNKHKISQDENEYFLYWDKDKYQLIEEIIKPLNQEKNE